MKWFPLLAIVFVFLVSALSAQIPDISLAGKWRFEIDRADAGKDASWFSRDLTDSILLPGVLQIIYRNTG